MRDGVVVAPLPDTELALVPLVDEDDSFELFSSLDLTGNEVCRLGINLSACEVVRLAAFFPGLPGALEAVLLWPSLGLAWVGSMIQSDVTISSLIGVLGLGLVFVDAELLKDLNSGEHGKRFGVFAVCCCCDLRDGFVGVKGCDLSYLDGLPDGESKAIVRFLLFFGVAKLIFWSIMVIEGIVAVCIKENISVDDDDDDDDDKT